MSDAPRPRIHSIPPHRPFADTLAAGLIRRFGSDPLKLARGVVLLPNNRAIRAVTDAFVRASGAGLLLPRLVAIGDPELGEAAGVLLDPADAGEAIPPAIDPFTRRMILARLVDAELARTGRRIDAAEALRLAGDLARALDQLLVEEVPARRLAEIELDETLSDHWRRSLELFRILIDRWPQELAALGRIDLADRRARLMDRLGAHWRSNPPQGFVCAAGITSPAPSIARLLRVVAFLPTGQVVLPALGTDLPQQQWEALGPHRPDPVTGNVRPSIETHPQFQLKLLLDRMGIARGEVTPFRGGGADDAGATPARSRAIDTALAPAQFTQDWVNTPAEARRLSGVRLLEVGTPAEEAQAIAIALRGALEVPGRTAALVTPDRALAARVAALCRRWGIEIDDSAGRPLSVLPPGTLLLAIADAASDGFAPVALLAMLKHPLVRAGVARVEWLEAVRALDLALRGPRPAAGLAGIERHLEDADAPDRLRRQAALGGWRTMHALLAPVEAVWAAGAQSIDRLAAALRDAVERLAGTEAWARPDGRAAAELLDALERDGALGPALVDPRSLPAMLRSLLEEVAIRPPQGGHPRLAIYGLIEARLQRADLMILGGLNEGSWPGLPVPDPWLAPRIRAELGLPGLERRIGVAAHDLAGALGASEVLLTRAARDATAPTIASRFWLRLRALAGEQAREAEELAQMARAIDDPADHQPAERPAPSPPAATRPRLLSVTEVDRLKADPFAFYAKRMLRLARLDPIDADNSAAWRGTAVHAVFERWARAGGDDPSALASHAVALLEDERIHPLMRALWGPRLMEAVAWMTGQLIEMAAEGRKLIDVEQSGRIEIAGVTLKGKYDRIDRLADGTLAIVDYKSGKPPSVAQVNEGFSMQLGLLALIAERGGFAGVSGVASRFEYWSLARNPKGGFGFVSSPTDPKRPNHIPADEFVARAARVFEDAARTWLTGDEPFTAKLNPLYAPYGDYDQLMRRDEWWGRD